MKKIAIALIALAAIAAGLWLLAKPHPREIAAKEAILNGQPPGSLEFVEIALKPSGAVCGMYRPAGSVDPDARRVFAFSEDDALHVVETNAPSKIPELSKVDAEKLSPSELVEWYTQSRIELARRDEQQRTIDAINQLCGFDPK